MLRRRHRGPAARGDRRQGDGLRRDRRSSSTSRRSPRAAAQKLGIKEPVGTTTEWKGIPQVKSFTTYYARRRRPGHQHPPHRRRRARRDHQAGRDVLGRTAASASAPGRRATSRRREIANGVARRRASAAACRSSRPRCSTPRSSPGSTSSSTRRTPIYLDRYPYGREATLGCPEPDQKIKNNTPYGILIWTSYTGTSVTVTLYSTQYAYGEQTGQTNGAVGACTARAHHPHQPLPRRPHRRPTPSAPSTGRAKAQLLIVDRCVDRPHAGSIAGQRWARRDRCEARGR